MRCLLKIEQGAIEAGPERSEGADQTRFEWGNTSIRTFAALRTGFWKLTLLSLMVLVCLIAGCKSTQQTSRIAIEDYQEMASAMAQSLRQTDAINLRTASDEPWIVSFDKVLNLSSEIMTQGEQWLVIASVRSAQPINTMWDDKRIAFVIPAQHAIDQRGTLDAERADKGFGSERAVTHTMTATFRSLTRAATDGQGRTDAYACEFQMLDLRSNETVWIDTFEFRRAAKGSIRD